MAIERLAGSIQTVPLLGGSRPQGGAVPEGGFAGSLNELVTAVEGTNRDANEAVGRMLDGSGDVHDAMIALQRADLTLQFTMQVRSKLIQAYQEIMRMPV
jgi:flagellar hook-basal body complex protein FliE